MFHKMAQMIQAHTERMLLDEVFATYRDVQDAAAEMAQVLPCPRCGKQTMKIARIIAPPAIYRKNSAGKWILQFSSKGVS